MPPADAVAAVRLDGITKRYGKLVANDHVSLHVHRGEILGLLGENGAGKSTLMKVLYGLTTPDEGAITVNGTAVRMSSPAQARRAGIGMVTQHFSLVSTMTVAENVTLGSTPAWIRRGELEQRVRAAGERFGIAVDPAERVEDLGVGQRQRVEILKALVNDCSVLILDEPTAVLTPSEVVTLFATIRRLTAAGLAVVIISHKLREIRELCDRVCVLHRGTLVGTCAVAEVVDADLVSMMVGGQAVGGHLDTPAPVAGDDGGQPADAPTRRPKPIPVKHGSTAALAAGAIVVEGPDAGRRLLDRVTIAVERGEIVGVAGVSGNGQTELVEVLSGMRPVASGSVHVGGRNVTNGTPATMVAAGLGRLAEDRHAAIVADMTVAQNLVLERLEQFRAGWRLDTTAIERHAANVIEQFAIRATPHTRMGTLSGGNMQKVLLARALSNDPVALVVAQPTRGLDINATQYVRQQLVEARNRGAGVLLVSEDLDELLGVADRLVVLNEGRLVGELPAHGATAERVGAIMAGATS